MTAHQYKAGTPSDSLIAAHNGATSHSPKALSHVGDVPQAGTMTDEEREAAAYRAGCAMHAWYSRYQETGDTAALDTAYSCLGMMRTLLAGRSPEYVARLEAQRGLA